VVAEISHLRSSSIGGRLPLEVVFHWRLSSIGGRLPLEVVFHWRLSSIGGRFPLEVVKLEYGMGGWVKNFEVVFRCRSSSFETFVHVGLVPLA
jgi:hypothetical protein